MAQPADEEQQPELEVDDEDNPNYKVPEMKDLNQILEQDKDDQSLQKYKQELLGGGEPGLVLFPDKPLNAVPVKLALQIEGRPDIELDLLQDLETIKKTHLVLKEGVTYRVRIFFHVQRDIVTGLRYTQNILRLKMKDGLINISTPALRYQHVTNRTVPIRSRPLGSLSLAVAVPECSAYLRKRNIKMAYVEYWSSLLVVDKGNYMIGSYPPRKEVHSYASPSDEAPSGMMARGQYKVESVFRDDDGHVFLKWEWTLEIKKDWKD